MTLLPSLRCAWGSAPARSFCPAAAQRRARPRDRGSDRPDHRAPRGRNRPDRPLECSTCPFPVGRAARAAGSCLRLSVQRCVKMSISAASGQPPRRRHGTQDFLPFPARSCKPCLCHSVSHVTDPEWIHLLAMSCDAAPRPLAPIRTAALDIARKASTVTTFTRLRDHAGRARDHRTTGVGEDRACGRRDC